MAKQQIKSGLGWKPKRMRAAFKARKSMGEHRKGMGEHRKGVGERRKSKGERRFWRSPFSILAWRTCGSSLASQGQGGQGFSETYRG